MSKRKTKILNGNLNKFLNKSSKMSTSEYICILKALIPNTISRYTKIKAK